MKKLALAILTVLLLSNTYAQDQSQQSLGIQWGYGQIQRQDLTVSPFIHQQWSPVNVLMTYRKSKKLVQQADLGFSLYNPSIVDPYDFTSYYNGKEEGLAHSFKQIDLNYAIGKSVMDIGNFNLVLGGKSRNFFYLSDYNFGPSGPSPMYISLGLDLWVQANYPLTTNQSISANVSVPVFAHVYRDPYLAQDDEFFENLYDHGGLKVFTNRIADGKIQSWGKYQRLDFDLRYSYSLGEKFDLGLTYYLTMNFNQSPTRFAQIGNIIYVGGNIKF